MKKQFDSLARGEHPDPHRILGGHPYQRGQEKGVIIRAFHPDAQSASLLLDGESIDMLRIHPGGTFEADLKDRSWPIPYRLRSPSLMAIIGRLKTRTVFSPPWVTWISTS